ncbi:MAG: PAS domain-containing protein [Gammaproteobacteria bacterium]|nr:PAS domain-containing protein [Gammaproteobacteria bacterium]
MINPNLDILNQLPASIFWKNNNLEFLGGNQSFLRAAGLSHVTDIVGKTDFDLPWSCTHADLYRKDDREILRGKIIYNQLETQLQATGQLVTVIVNKKPLYDQNNIPIGLIGSYMEKKPEPHRATLNILSKQQKYCLLYTIQGKSAKQIANQLGLSTRTIEFYLGLIKQKLACRNKAELISTALRLGFKA